MSKTRLMCVITLCGCTTLMAVSLVIDSFRRKENK